MDARTAGAPVARAGQDVSSAPPPPSPPPAAKLLLGTTGQLSGQTRRRGPACPEPPNRPGSVAGEQWPQAARLQVNASLPSASASARPGACGPEGSSWACVTADPSPRQLSGQPDTRSPSPQQTRERAEGAELARGGDGERGVAGGAEGAVWPTALGVTSVPRPEQGRAPAGCVAHGLRQPRASRARVGRRDSPSDVTAAS